MYNDSIEKLEINLEDIALTVFRPKKYLNNRKTIIHYHGWGSNTSTYELMGQIYALYGYQFVLPEIEKHGTRGSFEDESFSEAADIIIQTFAEFQDIKDIVINRLNGDRENILISGHSMGGAIAGSIFSRDLDIKGAIIYNSFFDYDKFFDEIAEIDDTDENREIKNLLNEFSPMKFIENLENRDMLIFVGEKDEVIPVIFMDEFKEKIESLNIDISKIIFSKHSDCAHSISYKMIEEGLRYTLDLIGTNSFDECCHNK